jgi:accessory gene regulator protein AgrB
VIIGVVVILGILVVVTFVIVVVVTGVVVIVGVVVTGVVVIVVVSFSPATSKTAPVMGTETIKIRKDIAKTSDKTVYLILLIYF